jgi:prophage regulatory protein
MERLRLIGAHEILVLLGRVSRQRVHQLTSRGDFPAPVIELAQGKVWLADDVETWIRNHCVGAADLGLGPSSVT